MDPSIEAVRNLVSEQDTACRSGTELMEILKPGNSKERKKKVNLESCFDREHPMVFFSPFKYSLSYVHKIWTYRYIP